MSRSCYSDDFGEEFPGQMDLFRANVARSMRSKAGQARLRELRAALLALPIKELHAETFTDGTREAPVVCALGAWAVARAEGDPDAARGLVASRVDPSEVDDELLAEALASYGWPRLVVLETVYTNDRDAAWRIESPAQRYTRILAWIDEWLIEGAR